MWIGCRGRRPDGIAKREGSGSERRERARGTSHHCHAASPAIAALLRQAGCERGIRLMHEPLGCSAAVSASVGAGDRRELDLDGRQPSLERGGHTGRCGRHDVLKGGRKAGRWAREVRVVDVGRAGRRLWHEAREKVGAHGRCAAASAGPRGHSGRARHAEGCGRGARERQHRKPWAESCERERPRPPQRLQVVRRRAPRTTRAVLVAVFRAIRGSFPSALAL